MMLINQMLRLGQQDSPVFERLIKSYPDVYGQTLEEAINKQKLFSKI